MGGWLSKNSVLVLLSTIRVAGLWTLSFPFSLFSLGEKGGWVGTCGFACVG